MKGLTKILITLIAGVGILALLYSLVVAPLMSEVNIINAEVRNKKTELAVLQKQIKAFKTAQSDLAKATRKQEILDAIPQKENLVVAVQDLEVAAANTNSGHILSIIENLTNTKDKRASTGPKTSVIAKKVNVEEVPYNLTVTNDFNGMVNFLNYLEHIPHFTEISKLTLGIEQNQSNGLIVRTGKITGEINGVFFYKTE